MNTLTEAATKQRVLVVEDDARMLSLLCRGLRDVGHTPMPASDGEGGLDLALRLDFDCVILDVGLPARDGCSVSRAIRAQKNVPILMLTARDGQEDVLRGFDCGADDYLTKPFSFRELLARLNGLQRTVPRRNTAALVLDPARLTMRASHATTQLTRNEFLLIAHLHQNAGVAVDRETLSEAVWGAKKEVSANLLDVLVNAVRSKLQPTGDTRLLQTVRGVGYRLQLDASGLPAPGDPHA